jgi:hypothetical protein
MHGEIAFQAQCLGRVLDDGPVPGVDVRLLQEPIAGVLQPRGNAHLLDGAERVELDAFRLSIPMRCPASRDRDDPVLRAPQIRLQLQEERDPVERFNPDFTSPRSCQNRQVRTTQELAIEGPRPLAGAVRRIERLRTRRGPSRRLY